MDELQLPQLNSNDLPSDDYTTTYQEQTGFLDAGDENLLRSGFYTDSSFTEDNTNVFLAKDSNEKTPIMLAVERDNADIVEALFEAGVDINQRLDSDGISLLHFAASSGSLNCIRWLVKQGLQVNDTDEARHWTPLHHAVFHGKLEGVKVLLELESCSDCEDKWGFTPIKRAIQNDDVAIAAALAESGVDLNQRVNSEGINLLHFAASSGSINCIRWLVKHGLQVNVTDEARLWTPLHHAVFHSKLEAVKVLLELESCTSCVDEWGFSPLMRAVQQDDTPIAEALLKSGADINQRSESGTINLLHFAAHSGGPNLIRWLVSRGLNVNETDDIRQWIPLHHAVFHGKLRAVEVLLELKSCITCKDKWGFTPLMRAVQRDDISIAEMLVKSGADINQRLESNGINFLHFAAHSGSPKCIRWLVAQGLNVNDTDEPRQWIPLHHAVFHGKLEAAKVLLELKSCLTCKDRWGFSPIMRAVQRDDIAITAELVAAGVDIKECLDSDKINILHFAASNGSPNSIRWLVDRGLDVNETDVARQWIPLHHAVFHRKLQAVEVLLELKSCVTCEDIWGFSLLKRSVQRDDTVIAEKLVEAGADINQRLELGTINLLHFAAHSGGPTVIRWLVSRGLNVNETDDIRQWIPLHHAIFHGKLDAVKVLLELKSCVSCRDKWHFTPIMRAVHRDDVPMAAALAKFGADLNERLDDDKITLLHFAASNGCPDSIRWLVRRGLDVNDSDEAKLWVPLHHAASHGKLQASRVVVSLGSCINCRDREGSTPRRLAMRDKHPHVAEYLRSVDGKE